MEHINIKLQETLNILSKTGKLFRVALTGEEIWKLYLKGFTKENNPVFRDPNSTVHNCNYCNNFIRRYGNVVAIGNDNEIISLFDTEVDEEYNNSFILMSEAIRKSVITEVFIEDFTMLQEMKYSNNISKSDSDYRLGLEKNVKRYTKEEAEKFGVVKENQIITFNHFSVRVPKTFINTSSVSAASLMAEYRSDKEVFKRALDEISESTFKLVVDLIVQGSLLNGDTYLEKVKTMLQFKRQYDGLPASQKDNWCWVNSYKLPIAKFKNELIGVFCSDLTQGMELNLTCQLWNKRVDPANYMKAVAPITKAQIEIAKKFIIANGYSEESFSNRRLATMDDIKVSEILHSNVGTEEIKPVSIFDNIASPATQHKKSEFSGVEEVAIDKFMADILPNCTSVEVFLEGIHEGNLVSLTTTDVKDAKPIFKWDSNYSWTFKGNLAGKSEIKEFIRSKGGAVDGVLRCSLVWNDDKEHKLRHDNSDLDLWCAQPNGDSIGFSRPYRKDQGNMFSSFDGQLDLDDRGYTNEVHAENIYFCDSRKLKDGTYTFWVNPWTVKDSKGFKAEIQFGNELYNFEYNKPLSHRVNVHIADVLVSNGVISISKFHLQPLELHSKVKTIWNLETNKFHKVNLVCLSPNHWGENKVGNKHYMFMLDGCKPQESLMGFHTENLSTELVECRKVLELIAHNNQIAIPENKVLSGVGFNSTVRNSLIVKLSGTHKRVIKLKF